MRRSVRAALAALIVLLGLSGCVVEPTGVGTRADPNPVGVTARVGSYEIAFGSTVTDAEAAVIAADPLNRPPIQGHRFVLVPLRLTYLGSSVGEPWLDLDIRFVAPGGTMYGGEDAEQCGVSPGPLEFVDQLPPGTTAWGAICVSVPAEAIPGGVWVARDGGRWGWHGFFAATAEQPTAPGSFAAPTAVNAVAVVGGYALSLARTNPDALGFVRSWDENTDPPAPGRRYVLVSVTATFDGTPPASGDPWGDLAFAFVTAEGATYGSSDEDGCGDIPDSLEEVGVLTAGRPATANLCVLVPAGQVDGGRWHVTPEGSAFVWAGHFALE